MTTQQRLALDKGNRIRFARADLKRELAKQPGLAEAGARAAALIELPSPEIAGMQVGRLLRSCRGIGPSKVRRVLLASGVLSDSRTVGELTERQRRALIGLLRGDHVARAA